MTKGQIIDKLADVGATIGTVITALASRDDGEKPEFTECPVPPPAWEAVVRDLSKAVTKLNEVIKAVS